MTVTSEGAALYVLIVILIFIVGILVTGAIVREWIRQRVSKENKDRELLGAIQSVHTAMQTICERVQNRVDVEKDNHIQLLSELHEVSKLVLDVEYRITKQVEETRSLIRNPRRDGTKIYNTQAEGGQTNQGGNVHGEQR